MAKMNANKCAMSAAGAFGALYVLCALFVMAWPAQSLQLKADFLHLTTLDHLAPILQVTAMNFISGLVQIMVYAYITVWMWCYIYNNMK